MARGPLDRARSRFWHMIGFGQTTAPTIEDGTVSKVQTRFSPLQSRDRVIHLQLFGFASALPEGSDVVTVSADGNPSQTVIIASGHQSYRFTGLANGEVVVHDQFGNYIHFTNGMVKANGPLTWTGNVKIVGNLVVTGEVTSHDGASHVALGTHDHTNTQPGGGVSGPPQAGT